MSFLKGLRGNPTKSAAKHKTRAMKLEEREEEERAAAEWVAAARDYTKIPDLKRARECYLRAAQLFQVCGGASREEAALRQASDLTLEEEDYEEAADVFDRLVNLATRLKDNRLLYRVLALKTLTLIAANKLSKAKETFHLAEKVKERLGSKESKNRLYVLAHALVKRFADGDTVPVSKLPEKVAESDAVNQLIARLVTAYRVTEDVVVSLSLQKETTPIKGNITGYCKVNSPVVLNLLEAKLLTPSSVSLPKPPVFGEKSGTSLSAAFTLQANLPGEFHIGPAYVLLELENQRFQLKSDSASLRVAAAKPRIYAEAQFPSEIHSQEEFELLLRVKNESHGDASEVTLRVTLPPSLRLQTGTLEKRIITLPAQEEVRFPLFIIASKIGEHEGSIDLEYKGASKRSRKETRPFTVTVKRRKRKHKE